MGGLLPTANLQVGTNLPNVSTNLPNVSINSPIPLTTPSVTVDVPQLNDAAALAKVGEELGIELAKVEITSPKTGIKSMFNPVDYQQTALKSKQAKFTDFAEKQLKAAEEMFEKAMAEPSTTEFVKNFINKNNSCWDYYNVTGKDGKLLYTKRELYHVAYFGSAKQVRVVDKTIYSIRDGNNMEADFSCDGSRKLKRVLIVSGNVDPYNHEGENSVEFNDFDDAGVAHSLAGKSLESGTLAPFKINMN